MWQIFLILSILKYEFKNVQFQRLQQGLAARSAPTSVKGRQLGNVIGKMRNNYEHKTVSDGKIQITILIPRRGPRLVHGDQDSGVRVGSVA